MVRCSSRAVKVLVMCAVALPLAAASAPAQQGTAPQPCAMPQLPPASRQQDLFSREQAAVLGEIVLEQVGRQFKLVRDPRLDEYLQRMADRMSQIAGIANVRVQLIDLSQANALTLPGGHVLMARKIVAMARSEDEVAGVLAHEFGHIIKGDPERDLSAALRSKLKITSVGDRADIAAKYNLLIENWQRSGNAVERESAREQLIADQVAVWLMARAGYAPQAYADVFDRLTDLRSNTGNWVSDFFGTTKPEARRLREALKAAAALPPACVGTRQSTPAQFEDWQRDAIEAERASRTAALHGVISERKLEPALRSDLGQLKFSPDGKWVLAQDDSNLYVFTRDPLAFVFRIDASDAFSAQFTPDSTAIVFHDTSYRVERWSLVSRNREWVREVLMPPQGCAQSALSADGIWIACVTPEFAVRLQEVASGKLVFEKERFYVPTLEDLIGLLYAARDRIFQMQFSPDAHYLVVARGDTWLAFDCLKRATLSLPGAIRDRIGTSFSFLNDGRIVGIYARDPQQSAVLTFPEGQVVATLKLGRQAVTAATHGDRYIILRGIPGYQATVFDVKANKVVLGTPLPGLDLYDNSFLSERKNGELGLYTVGTTAAVATITVPIGSLGRLRAADASPDALVLAISEASRGGIWDATTGQRTNFVRGFAGVSLDASHQALADFPASGVSQRVVGLIDPVTHQANPLVGIEVPRPPSPAGGKATAPKGDLLVRATVTAWGVTLYGRFLLGWQVKPGWAVEPRPVAVYDATSGKELWSRPFPKGEPAAFRAEGRHGTLMFHWPYTSETARSIVDAHPELKTRFEAMHARREDVSVTEILDLATGRTRGYILLDSANGSVRMRSVTASGDAVVFNDNQNRTVVYSLATGNETGHAFGTPLDVSNDGSVVAVQNEPGRVARYSLPAMEKIDELTFTSEVAFARFAADGSKLVLLTTDQTVYTVKVR